MIWAYFDVKVLYAAGIEEIPSQASRGPVGLPSIGLASNH